MAENAELVFFDTFSHESSEEINLDLVQFPNIVYISEVRIIPLGARVQADFPGGVRLGATNPSQFEIEFFVNDLEKPGACTFESLGGFEYKQNGSIHLECKRKVPTDGLVLRGWYTTITLAVYGIPRDAMQEQTTSANAHSHSHLTLPLTSEALPPPEAVAASAATQEWVQQHAQVAEAERAYMVESSHSGDLYNNGSYSSDQHQAVPLGPASGDYTSGHNYHEEWNHQTNHGATSSRTVLHSGSSNVANDGYDGPKETQRSYETDPLPWEGASSRSDRDWERDRDRKDRERDRDRDRERDRERDRDRDRERDREHDRERERLRDRGRDRDRDVYSRERSRDRSRDRSPDRDRDWDDRRRDDRDRNRDKARDRSNSGSRDYSRAVSRDRDRDREPDWESKRRSGDWPSRRERDHDREHNRSSNSWGERSPDDHHRLPAYGGHRDRKQRDGSWDRDRDRDRDRERDRERDRDRGSHHGADWEDRDRDDVPPNRKRPRTPPNPPHVPHKRPHTPPEDKAQRSPSVPPPLLLKKEASSSPQQVQFGSISPGDVESISEGEIPEADTEADIDSASAAGQDSLSVPPPPTGEGELGLDPTPETSTSTPILDDTTVREDVMRPLSVDPLVDDAREREAAANLALLAAGGDPSVLAAAVAAAAAATRPPNALLATPSPLASPAASVSSTTSASAAAAAAAAAQGSVARVPAPALPSPVKVQVPTPAGVTRTQTSSPVPPSLLCATPATPPAPSSVAQAPPASTSATSVATAASVTDSPLNHDEASLDGEQFEPILSDEDIEDDGQFQDMEFFGEESEELSKAFNPFQFELQPLVYLKDPSVSPCEAQFIRKHQKHLEKKCQKEESKTAKHFNQSSGQAELPGELIPDEALRLEELVLQFEDVNKVEVREAWVHAAEQACNIIHLGLPYSKYRIEIIERLMTWVRVGLDFKRAFRQPQLGYKIRHIKAGVRLVEMLCMCSGAVTELLIMNERIHQRLLRLYHQDCMSLSIRLMILRALDASLRSRMSVEHFLKVKFSVPRGNHLKLADRLKAKAKRKQVNKVNRNKKGVPLTGKKMTKVVKPKSLEKGNDRRDKTNPDMDKFGMEEQKCRSAFENEKLEIEERIGGEEENPSSEKAAKMGTDPEMSISIQETRKSDETMEMEVDSTERLEQADDRIESTRKNFKVGKKTKTILKKSKMVCPSKGKKKVQIHCKKVIVKLNGKKFARVVKKRVPLNVAETCHELNGYQCLLYMFKGEKLTRTKFALCNLIRKLHFYEVLEKLKSTVKLLIKSNHVSQSDGRPGRKQLPVPAKIGTYLKSVVDYPHLNANFETTDTLVACLSEITSVYQQAPIMLAQPKRFLPGHAQFDLVACSQESQRPYLALFSYFRCHNFLECCNLLLTLPQTMNCNVVLGPLYDLIKSLSESQEGLQFLASHVDATNLMLRILLQQPSNEELQEESTMSCLSSQYLGVCIAYRLQVLHFMDQILEAVSSGNTDAERQEVFENLLGLYYLSFSNIGKSSLIHILSSGDFIKVLLDLQNYHPPNTDAKYRKYPGKNFVEDLIISAVKFSYSGSFLQQFGIPILQAARNSNSKLQEVLPYLKIIENQTLFSYDDISPLCEIIKRNIDQTGTFPGELVTALRILRHLAVPSQGSESGVDNNANCQYSYLELKHKYVILELFSLDGVSHMTAILSRVCEAYEQPALHASAFLGARGAIVMSILLPALELLRQMLTLAIQCRNTDFRDLTAINVLVQTFTLVNAFPSNAFASEAAQKGAREIIETLLAYTQPVQPESSSEKEGLNNSLWTLMMADVLKYITTNAHTFMSGLLLLSELLPLPLPVQTRTSLPADEVAQTISSRKLWCAHLHSLSSTIGDLISTLCGSSCPPLLQLLRRVCVQLSDLAAPTALVVSRSVLDGILVSLNIQLKTQPNNPAPALSEGPCSSHTARLLNFLACLITHASVKSAVLNLLCAGGRGSGVKADERFPQLVSHLCHILRSAYDTPSHVQAQECVVSIMQSLCDVDISLMTPPSSGSVSTISYQQFLASALPPRELLSLFCSVLLEHMSNTQHSFTTLLPTVRTFLMLVEHDYGFYHLKSCMLKKTDALWHLFSKFCSSFSKDSSDLLSTLSTSLELLRVCITPEGEYSDFETISSRIKLVVKSNGSPLPSGALKNMEHIKEEKVESAEIDALASRSSEEQATALIKIEPDLQSMDVESNEESSEDQVAGKKLDAPLDLPTEQQPHCEANASNPHLHHITQALSKSQTMDLDPSSNVVVPTRKLLLSVPELALVLGWHRTDLPAHSEDVKEADGFHKRHPILNLEKLLRECCVEEESLESLHENVLGLIHILDDEASLPSEHKACDAIEIILPPPESLLTQFAHRPVFSICEPDDDRLSQGYWLSVPASDETDQDTEQVTCNLLDLTREYIPDFHLLSDSVRLCRLRAGLGDEVDVDRTDVDITKKRMTGDDGKYMSTDLKTRRPFVTPMRGRGFSRPVPQRGDLFRSRPPNTSRPPSLHVDDFVALETCGAQPTGPTGYNKLSMRAAKDMMATRSRGRGRGFGSDRGRFFGSGHQYRREGGLRVSNIRGGDGPGAWVPHEGQGQMAGIGPQRPFRAVDQCRDGRVMREEKFGSSLAGRLGGLRTGGNWPGGKERDRFGGPGGGPGPMGRGGGNSRRDSGRHQRTFTR